MGPTSPRALTALVDRGYTTRTMRILTSVAIVALVVSLPWTVLAAPFMQSSIDIKALALTKADLKSGFDVVPDRTVSEERPDGVAVYDVTFARERTPDNLGAGPFEIRSGVARTAQVDDAKAQLSSTRDAFVAEGWNEVPVQPWAMRHLA